MTKHQRQTMTARYAFCEPDGSYYCYYEGYAVRLWGTASDLRVRYLDTAVGYDVIAPDTPIEVEETEVRGSYDEVSDERDALAARVDALEELLRLIPQVNGGMARVRDVKMIIDKVLNDEDTD